MLKPIQYALVTCHLHCNLILLSALPSKPAAAVCKHVPGRTVACQAGHVHQTYEACTVTGHVAKPYTQGVPGICYVLLSKQTIDLLF